MQAESLVGRRVAASLREAILSGAMKPGARIRQEELAERFGSSRIPVREALRVLEAEGLVRLVANSGAWVAKLDLAECLETYKMRERLEPLALGEGIQALTEEEIARLEALAAEMEAAKEVETFLHLDRVFHLLSCSRAGMPMLEATIRSFWDRTQHYRRAYASLIGQEGQWVIHHEHRLLVEALRRRDRTDAEALLALHIRRTRLALAAHREIF